MSGMDVNELKGAALAMQKLNQKNVPEETMGNSVTMTIDEYFCYVQDRKVLHALLEAGVSNWDGYSNALMTLCNEKEKI